MNYKQLWADLSDSEKDACKAAFSTGVDFQIAEVGWNSIGGEIFRRGWLEHRLYVQK